MQIVNLSPAAILYLAEAATRADAEGRKLRVNFGQSNGINTLSYKVGEGAWSPPFYDQPDEYASPPRLTSQARPL